MSLKARSHGLVVKADGSRPKGCGFKPQHHILDGCKQFASYYIKEKLIIKVAKRGTPKNKCLKKLTIKVSLNMKYQIYDDLTLFFGGSNSNRAIQTYNWTSSSYASYTPQLTNTRLYSACAVLKGNNFIKI